MTHQWQPLLAAVFWTIGIACEPVGPPPVEVETDAGERPLVLTFETTSAERALGDCVAGSPGCSYVRFDHPNVVTPPPELAACAQAVTDAVQDFLSRPLRPDGEPASPRELFALFLEDAETAAEPLPWYLERRVYVVHQTPEVLSLGFVERQFMGGAHGLETFSFENFEVPTGERLGLDDIVLDTKLEALRLLAERAFRETRQLPAEADLAESGFEFDEDRFTLTENFAIAEDGLTFYYNPNEIAAYAEGPTELELAYEELEGILAPFVTGDR